MVNKPLLRTFFVAVLCAPLVACVTQKYGDHDNPIVERETSEEELATTRITLALAHLRNGNTSQAKQNLELAKKHAPYFVDVYTSFAHYYEHVGEYEQAEASYYKALSIKKDDADTLNNFGVYYCRRDQLEKAEEVFLKAIAVPSYIRVSESYENLAVCHLKAHSFKRAEVFLDKAIMHSPNSLSSLYLMAQLQYAKGDFRQGVNVLRRYELASSRISPQMLGLSYKLFKAVGDNVKAQEYLGILMTLHPKSPQALAYIKNELSETDTDILRKAYIKKHQSVAQTGKKKKTLVLKPNTKQGLMILPEQDKPTEVYTVEQNASDEITTDKRLVSPEPITQKQVAVNKESHAAKVQAPIIDKTNAVSQGQTESSEGQKMTLPIHVVVKGDNLSVISRKYNIKLSKLKEWNRMADINKLQLGAVVYLADPNDLVNSASPAQ